MAKRSSGKADGGSESNRGLTRINADGDGDYNARNSMAVMYAGPEVTYLRPGMVFRSGELPKFLAGYIEECPEVGELFVPAANYAAARADVERVGSKLWLAARAVSDHFKGR
jgi:hypothetical protein